jgi:DNA polymerase III gamma/tau subunit
MAAGPQRLLPTVLSRLTVLPLRRYPEADIREILRREWQTQGQPLPDDDTLAFYAATPMASPARPSIF